MIDTNKILSVFRKKHPSLIIMMIIDYDKDHYIVEAVKNPNEVDYSDPYYGVDKKTGAVTYFTPAYDLEAFNDALDNRVIWTRGQDEEKELVHHGIKGQKWGVRRYQNEDGTLTAEGRQRLGYEPKKAKKVANLIKKGGGNYFKPNKIAKAKLMSNSYLGDTLVKDKEYLKAVNNYRALQMPYRQEGAKARHELSDDAKYEAEYQELRNIFKKEGKDPYPTSDEVIDYVISKNNPKLASDMKKAADAYNKSIANVTEKLLGDYGNDTFERLSTEVTVSQATREFILNEGENMIYASGVLKNIFDYKYPDIK